MLMVSSHSCLQGQVVFLLDVHFRHRARLPNDDIRDAKGRKTQICVHYADTRDNPCQSLRSTHQAAEPLKGRRVVGLDFLASRTVRFGRTSRPGVTCLAPTASGRWSHDGIRTGSRKVSAALGRHDAWR